MMVVPALTLSLLLGTVGAPHATASSDCRLQGAQQRWIESALASWERVRARALGLPGAPLPTLIFFDRRCTFTIPAKGYTPRSMQVRFGTTRLGVQSLEHRDTIRLPNGRLQPPRPATFASLMPGDTAAFVVIGMESIWRAFGPRQLNEDLNDYLRRVLVHEMTHARQLAGWVPLARIAGGRVGLVDLDDDIVQQRFASVPGFREAVAREVDLLYQAAVASGNRQRELVREAIRAIRERREWYYRGANAPWAEIEQLWLDLEGAGQWAALAHVRLSAPRTSLRDAVDIVRESRSFWSQEEGLALFLALDALVPGWQRQVFAADPKSSLELLEEALRS